MVDAMDFITSPLPVPYPDATNAQEARVAAIRAGTAGESVWFLEHPPLYTAGTSAKAGDLLNARFPVYETGRGGQYTYHGPGQRVAYVMVDLHKRGGDVRKFVHDLEQVVIDTLAAFKISGTRVPGRVGIWVGNDKIAAIGVRVRSGVTYHGVSVNVNPDLSHYAGIIPCGIADAGVTSLHALGKKITLEEVDAVLKKKFTACFAV